MGCCRAEGTCSRGVVQPGRGDQIAGLYLLPSMGRTVILRIYLDVSATCFLPNPALPGPASSDLIRSTGWTFQPSRAPLVPS